MNHQREDIKIMNNNDCWKIFNLNCHDNYSSFLNSNIETLNNDIEYKSSNLNAYNLKYHYSIEFFIFITILALIVYICINSRIFNLRLDDSQVICRMATIRNNIDDKDEDIMEQNFEIR